MSERFIFRDEIFQPAKVESEDHLEKLVVENADVLFPHAYIFDFKAKALTPLGQSTISDMCLVSHGCTKWWIIETELSKPRSYVFGTIQPQISRQQQADWSKTADKAIQILCDKGVPKEMARNLKSIEPEFIILYDDLNDDISFIADEHGFKEMIVKPLRSQKGKYALLPIRQDVNPAPVEDDVIKTRMPKGGWKVVGNRIWVPIPSDITRRLGERRISVVIDGIISQVQINPANTIQIPISSEEDSQSSRVVYNQLNCLFDIDEEPDEVRLLFREQKRWKK